MAADATEPRDGSDRASAWSRGDAVAAAAIFAGALVLRLLHLQQIRANDPFFFNPAIDPRFHHEAAVRISSGDVFTTSVELLASIYPYFLAAIYFVTGPSFLAARAVQSVLGALSCVLIFALARRLFDRRVAVVAGSMAAVYSMLIFYGGTLTIANVLVPLTVLVLLCADRAGEEPGLASWSLCGGLVGLTALARPTALLFAPLLLPWIAWPRRHGSGPGRRLAFAAAFCAGIALVIVPLNARLNIMGDDWRGGINFYVGNNPRSIGTFRPPALYPDLRLDDPIVMREAFERYAEERLGRELEPAELSRFWVGESLRFIGEHPGAWLRLELRKLALFFNALEVWTLRSYTIDKSFSWVLRLPLLGFGVVTPLALLGAVVARRQWRRLVPLYLMVGAYLATALLFFVAARYRLPSVPVLIVLAAVACVHLFDAARARNLRAFALAVPLLAAAGGVVHLQILSDNLTGAYYNLGNRYKELEKWDLAIASYHRSLAGNPGSVSTWNNLALALEGSGEHDAEAIEIWQRIHAWAESRSSERYRERAARHLRQLGAAPAEAPSGAAPESLPLE